MAKVERNTQHPSQEDRKILREMANRVDPEEMIRMIGSIIANDHPDAEAGALIRRKLHLLSVDLSEDMDWLCRAEG